MRLDIITCLPDLFDGPMNQSIVKRSQTKGHVEIAIHNLRDYATNKHKNVDDYAYGGGAGMVLSVEPIDKCISGLKEQRTYEEVIYLTPDGETLNQRMANQLSLNENMILLCGHYKGVDQRVRDHLVTKEISIGDYVLSGGELAAMVLADALIRLVPGVLNDESSALTDSFQDNLLAPPVYSRPVEYKGWKVPEVLTSGHEANIEKWRHDQAVKRTEERRPDLLD
ncbi:tRNA (guanosine(37)-N1)-methyltransferase TrmD [Marinoscillum furvescens]|uniref:tRNA (guanine-N(1)-)-methyltransferase n=1 Tax=Marinoscillum furvescens DSM 4134 TaxID=1122208 RepID=A0A3D9LJP2_MARFU|nr:tRNA (guanosine(37)-N1)-methyltransferase TrmD [Marinoscillum furvescens]REE05876.1 tRNA (guanine37-N(1)-) methyltransferase [Marinoscillum furvescens DSM 4134]